MFKKDVPVQKHDAVIPELSVDTSAQPISNLLSSAPLSWILDTLVMACVPDGHLKSRRPSNEFRYAPFVTDNRANIVMDIAI